MNLKDLLEEIENKLIIEALERSKGVKNRAAQLLGLKRTTLIEKLKKKKNKGIIIALKFKKFPPN